MIGLSNNWIAGSTDIPSKKIMGRRVDLRGILHIESSGLSNYLGNAM